MTILKSKIKVISSLPNSPEDNNKKTNIIITIIVLIILLGISYLIYTNVKPYINAININKITGKKIYITECNTKDYIIIGKDKSYSLELTNSNCIKEYYEGTLFIKNNEIIFNDKLKGYIDKEYNILINNNKFVGESNE